MVKSIDSRNCELGHVLGTLQGEGSMTFRYIGSKSGLVDQISAYMDHAKSRRSICNVIEPRERAAVSLRAGLMAVEIPGRLTDP